MHQKLAEILQWQRASHPCYEIVADTSEIFTRCRSGDLEWRHLQKGTQGCGTKASQKPDASMSTRGGEGMRDPSWLHNNYIPRTHARPLGEASTLLRYGQSVSRAQQCVKVQTVVITDYTALGCKGQLRLVRRYQWRIKLLAVQNLSLQLQAQQSCTSGFHAYRILCPLLHRSATRLEHARMREALSFCRF